MKRIHLTIFVAIFTFGVSFAQGGYRKSVSVIGDSYSTFEGFMPEGYEIFYRSGRQIGDNDVVKVEQMWWHQLIKKNGWKLDINNSFSGSTISSSGYNGADYTSRSFVTRMSNMGNPDIIFIFGATNDSWVPAPIGDYKYEGWTKEDLKAFRPSLCKMLDFMTKRYLNTDIYFLLNSELSADINTSVKAICEHYHIPVIELHDIEKKMNHPSAAGMTAIADQVDAFVRNAHHQKKMTQTDAAKQVQPRQTQPAQSRVLGNNPRVRQLTRNRMRNNTVRSGNTVIGRKTSRNITTNKVRNAQ
ncbi:MAG: hypothetical protein GXY64_06835 [Bacteroidales bacterium]|nr:hypothetical protein [Bacteroidales bacterium]